MEKQFKQLKEFHEKFGQLWQDAPNDVDAQTRDLRISIMREELEEAIEAMKNEPIENIAKELADVLYVVYGTAGPYGLSDKMEEIFDEVHRSNMSKLGEDGKPVYREDGKALKGPNYSPADVKSILEKK